MGKHVKFATLDEKSDDQTQSSIDSEEYPTEDSKVLEAEEKIDYSKLTSIDDLPSDDSVSISSSSDEDNEVGEDDASSLNSEENQKMSIGERLAQMSNKPLKQKKLGPKQDVANTQLKKKKSKNAPTEVPSSRAQYSIEKSRRKYLLCSEFSSDKYKPRDPRMTTLGGGGHYNAYSFDRRYGFIEEVCLFPFYS